MAALAEPLRRARDHALDTVSWVSGFDFPDVEGDYRFVSLRTPGHYPIESGRVASSDGLDLTRIGLRPHWWSKSTWRVPPHCTRGWAVSSTT